MQYYIVWSRQFEVEISFIQWEPYTFSIHIYTVFNKILQIAQDTQRILSFLVTFL